MYYSAIVILAISILIIENHDILLKLGNSLANPVWKMYRKFLIAILIYYTTDALWGLFEYMKNPLLLYIDTTFYFLAIAGGILFWTKFVATYLDQKSRFGKSLIYIGKAFFVVFAAAVVINFFNPVLFEVNEQCIYIAHPIRHILLVCQISLWFQTSIVAISSSFHGNHKESKRFRTISYFGFIMDILLTIQIWKPYAPFYTVAYMVGTCLLHTFVVNDEREEYKAELEKSLKREKEQYEELLNTRTLAYKDALTGVKSKLAYVEYEAKKNDAISKGIDIHFSVAVFDVNGLKKINDTLGHKKGDQLIISACTTICKHFKHSPVFRIGGDEFVAFFENEDYENRYELEESFNAKMECKDDPEQPVIAMGVSDFISGQDNSLHDVFIRADKLMYERKHKLKNSEYNKK